MIIRIPKWFTTVLYTKTVCVSIYHFGNNIITAVINLNLRLKDLREDADVLQKDVAEYLKCSQVCYSRYENGNRDIPLEVLCRLADFFDTSTDYILGRTDNPEKVQNKKT